MTTEADTTDLATLCDLFFAAAAHDKPDCMLHKEGGEWIPTSTADFSRQVQQLAKTLGELGVERGDRVALMADNGPHWPIVDFATLCAGGVLVPIYPTLETSEEIFHDHPSSSAIYVAKDCGAKVIIAEGRERIEGLHAMRHELPDAEHFAVIEPGAEPTADYTTLDALVEQGAGADPAAFEAKARQAAPDDLATFIYTSGTTGNPKGVMLTHGNIASNVAAAMPRIRLEPGWRALAFLPLSHSFERTVDYIYWLAGTTIAFAESVAAVPKNMQEVEPHVFVSVPRVYEKFYAKVQDTLTTAPAHKRMLFGWATSVGRRCLDYRLRGERPPGLLGLKLALADALVLGKIKGRFGGNYVQACSGGAPLARDLAEFFWGAGIEIYEGYGLTETSPVLTNNYPKHVKLGTVGTALPGVTLRIADDGEILAKGPNVMQGYYKLPEATAEAIDEDGWFHTGDIGQIDEEGFLSITDRKKELIVNAYGKNIAPAPIENSLKSSRYIGQAVVIGDRRKFLSALIVPDFEALRSWATRQGVAADGAEALIAAPEVRELFAAEVAAVNEDLARYEQIKGWDLIATDFTIEGGELTPTHKVKRRVVRDKYGDVIDGIYAAAEAAAH